VRPQDMDKINFAHEADLIVGRKGELLDIGGRSTGIIAHGVGSKGDRHGPRLSINLCAASTRSFIPGNKDRQGVPWNRRGIMQYVKKSYPSIIYVALPNADATAANAFTICVSSPGRIFIQKVLQTDSCTTQII
jgi:hypothetical protein